MTPGAGSARAQVIAAAQVVAAHLPASHPAAAWLAAFAMGAQRLPPRPPPEIGDPWLRALCQLSDARQDVWRHPTHAPQQVRAVLAMAAAAAGVPVAGMHREAAERALGTWRGAP